MGWLKFQRVKLRNWLSFGCDSTRLLLDAHRNSKFFLRLDPCLDAESLQLLTEIDDRRVVCCTHKLCINKYAHSI